MRGKKIAAAQTDEDVDIEVADEALVMITKALGDSPLPFVQSCFMAKEACEKLQLRYVGKTLINNLCVLNSLLNVKTKKEELIGDHTAKMKRKGARLAAVNDPNSE